MCVEVVSGLATRRTAESSRIEAASISPPAPLPKTPHTPLLPSTVKEPKPFSGSSPAALDGDQDGVGGNQG